MKSWLRGWAGLLLILGGLAEAQAGPFFTGLGDLPGGSFASRALGISADGSAVVGWSVSASGVEAFRWTQAGGTVGLGDLPGGNFSSEASGVSADGSVVVGRGSSIFLGFAEVSEAFRWTQAGGMVGLGDLPGGNFSSEASGVSADGSVVVGTGRSASGVEAFRWTSSGGMVGLGDLLGGSFFSRAEGVSADGSVVVGYSNYVNSGGAFPPYQAFRWTQAGGMVGLGDLPGGPLSSEAFGVSADGSVVVGRGRRSGSITEAFRWTQAGGMVGLGDLPGGSFSSTALAASADGSVVVGRGRTVLGDEAFISDAANGMRNLRTVLVNDFALDLTGWTLQEASGVSADGLRIVGYGTNPSGQPEAFFADLSTGTTAVVPEPSSVILLGMGAIGLLGYGRRQRKRAAA